MAGQRPVIGKILHANAGSEYAFHALAAGFLCNALIRPVKAKWHIAVHAGNNPGHAKTFRPSAAYGIGRGGFDAKAFLAWMAVGVPLSWGVWKTLENAAKIF